MHPRHGCRLLLIRVFPHDLLVQLFGFRIAQLLVTLGQPDERQGGNRPVLFIGRENRAVLFDRSFEVSLHFRFVLGSFEVDSRRMCGLSEQCADYQSCGDRHN